MSTTRRTRITNKLGEKIKHLHRQIAERDASMQRPVLQKKLAETQGQLAATKDELGKVKSELATTTAVLRDCEQASDVKDRTILELQTRLNEVVA
jgi:chromosome segregation ATPase